MTAAAGPTGADLLDLLADAVAARVADRLATDLADRLTATQTPPRFYNEGEVAKILRKRPAEVKKLLDDGRLWRVEGLDSSRSLIPAAALEALAARPEGDQR